MIRTILIFCIPVFLHSNIAFVNDVSAEEGLAIAGFLNSKSFLIKIFEEEAEVSDYQIGLSALQKIRGSWQFKNSIRYSGLVLSQTWQIEAGYDSKEAFQMIAEWFGDRSGSKVLFQCKGRSCGSSSQWASRIFKRRLLYGRGDSQRYAVYQISKLANMWLVVYSSARSNNRQYIQTVLIRTHDDQNQKVKIQ